MAKTVVFIDSRVNDLDLLVSQFEAGTEYKLLDAAHDGLLQIEELLMGKSDYSSIQIISHGSPGAITIGSTCLTENNLFSYQSQLENIGQALIDSGDLLLYGCNVGAGATGQHFIETLAQLTGADVAASDDVTGGVAAVGDWELEVKSGTIDSAIPVADPALQQYDHTLGFAEDYLFAKMSLVAYYDNPDNPNEPDKHIRQIAVDSWTALKGDGWRIIENTPYKEGSFAATVFQNDDKVVIAYRGTEVGDNGDFMADLAVGALRDDLWNVQFSDALNYALEIKAKYSSAEILVTGHSLGGALSQVTSQMFGFSGVTFDPGGAANLANTFNPWFGILSVKYSIKWGGEGVSPSFLNYVVDGSLVSHLSGDHIGGIERIAKPGISWWDQFGSVDTIHSMAGIVELMRQSANEAGENYYGSADNDVCPMSYGPNHMYGFGGNDLLLGGSGNDTLNGGDGNDSLRGGDGDDLIFADAGDDVLEGNGGNDTIDGGSGNDTALFRGCFADYSISLDKNSLMFTLTDSVSGREGTDQLTHVESFAFEDKTLNAGDACTVVNGSYRNESLYGNDLNNLLLGEGGNDVLEGKRGNDTIDGGSGFDTVIFTGTYAEYTITQNADQTSFTITDKIAGRDGTDLVSGVEQYRFAYDDVRDAAHLIDGGGGETHGWWSYYGFCQRVSSCTKLFPEHTMGEWQNGDHFAAILSDGSVFTWCTNGDYERIDGNVATLEVFSARWAFAALQSDGSVVSWGANPQGGDSSLVADKLDGSVRVEQVFSTQFAFAALREDGSVVTWGDSGSGGDSSNVASMLNGDEDVLQVFSTGSAFAALRKDGSVVTWGDSGSGGDSSLVVDQLDGSVRVEQVFSTRFAFAALREDGSVVTWGNSGRGGDSSNVASKLNGYENVLQLFSTSGAFAALREDGSVVTWGDYRDGGDSSIVADKLNGSIRIEQLFSTSSAFAALRSDGSVVTWGNNGSGGDSRIVADKLNGSIRIEQLFSTSGAFAALRSDGSVVTWGLNTYGGDSSYVASELNGDVDVVHVFSTTYSFAALRLDGSVVTWGDNTHGGDSSLVASELNGDVDVVSVSSSTDAFAALRSDGSGVTWGASWPYYNSLNVIPLLQNVQDISDLYTNNMGDQMRSGTPDDDHLYGNIGNDILWGNGGNDMLAAMGGNDLAFGGFGNDLFIGGEGEGDDVYVGGEGVDTVKYTSALAGITVDLVEGTAYSTDGNDAAAIGSDVLIDIENVIAGNFNDILIGNAVANSLEGGAGDDWLRSGGGADTLDGGTGSDTADYFDMAVPLMVTLNGAVDATVMVGGVAEDTIRNIENLVGGEGNDTFIGDSADNVFHGGAGNDTLDGGIGLDTADYSDKTEAVSVILQGSLDAIVTVGGVAEDTIRNIENLIGGSVNDTFIGDAMANSLFGGDGDDTLQGGAGNDTLDGGLDSDTIVFRGNSAQYSISYDFDNKTYTVTDSVSGRDGSDLVTGAEFFQFADGVHAVADLLDIVPPYLLAVAPAEYSTNVAVGANIVFTFTEPVQAVSGSILLQKGGATVMTIDVTDTAQVIFNGSTLTINPSVNLAFDTEYTVSIGAGAIADLAGNNYGGTDSYDFTTASALSVHNLHGSVTFWKTGTAIADVTSTLISVPAATGTQPIEFRNMHIAADGTRTIEIWETSGQSDTNSVELTFALPIGSVATWENAAALPSGWNLLGNADKAGEFTLGGMGLTALSSGSVKLGTLTLTAPTNPQHFELMLTSGELGSDTVPAFGIASESVTTGSDGLYEHLDMPDGTYALISGKVSGTTESNAITAQDALAALKMAVGMNPNSDGSDVSPYQFLAADVNKDGLVKATDALNILKMAVGLPSAPANEWLFVPESVGSESMTRTHVVWPDNPLSVTLEVDQEVHLIGIVKGDVDGSWAA